MIQIVGGGDMVLAWESMTILEHAVNEGMYLTNIFNFASYITSSKHNEQTSVNPNKTIEYRL